MTDTSLSSELAERIEQIRDRLAKATPGIWVVCNHGHTLSVDAQDGAIATIEYEWRDGLPIDDEGQGNADFIANAKSDIEWLLDTLSSARGDSMGSSAAERDIPRNVHDGKEGEIRDRLLVRAHSIDVLAGWGPDADLMREAAALLRPLPGESGASFVLVPCENCGTEGRIYRARSGHPNDPDAIDCGRCPVCKGTGGVHVEAEPITMEDLPLSEGVHLGLLDDMEHEAKCAGDDEYRKSELRIQALGAAISRRDWHATEQAHAAIRDKFYSHKNAAPLTSSHVAPAHPQAADEQNPPSDKARIAELEKRLDDCEASLAIFDEGETSEYWLRHGVYHNPALTGVANK